MANLDISLGNRSESSGRFNFVRGADGDVQFDETEGHAVVTSIVEDKGGNKFDRNHGTNIAKQRSLTERTPSQTEAMAIEGVESLEKTEKSIVDFQVTATTNRSTGRLNLDFSWSTPSGARQRRREEV